jgi:CRISPR-associated endonuclease/helicase Cas3
VSKPTPQQFAEFYEAVNGFEPFPWHVRLAKRVCDGDWPRAIALPTAAGKTSCIDIAVFALACQAKNAARRIFFVVDRRIVVDQAFEHASKLAEWLRTSETKVVRLVADALRDIAFPDWRDLPDEEQKDVRPLDVYALRGGMYRESAWTRSPLQPTVITSTVDQVGSRLLFRGYGVSDSMRPIHAGLVGNDALILLDEAHCAKPFDETVQAVKTFRQWHDSRTPFAFVSLTATPTTDENVMHSDTADDKHSVLGKRIKASKPATLVAGKATAGKKAQEELLASLEKHARELAKEYACVGIIVNRVKTARQLRDSLKQEFGDEVVLLTGRMRPLDRDHIYNTRLKSLLSKPENKEPPPKFVIGTQCLECGADFDFHALVTECASLDALRQRFGRLNRVANRPSAKAVVVIRGDQIEPKDVDPIYGNSLPQTWKWLNIVAPDGVFDFGVSSVREALLDVSREQLEQLNAPAESAPVLFPAHLDCWVQTHPTPTPDPDPALFLHGPKRPGQPDVQVVFRFDLGADSESWVDIVTLCPPSSSEAVAVPISVFKNWLAGERIDDQSSDVEGETFEAEPERNASDRKAVCWRGPEKSRLVSRPDEVQPNQVFVIPCSAPDVRSLADFISDVPRDYAEEAFQKSRDKALLRLPGLELDEDDEFDSKLSDAIEQRIAAQFPNWSNRATASLLERRRMIERYPEPLKGFVVSGRKRLGQFDPTYLDDTEPADSYLGQVITLDTHSRGVAEFAKRFAESCGLDIELYYAAGLFHDLGKLDPRFQAMLKQCSPRTAVGTPWAKSAKAPRTPRERKLARLVHHYPKSARHELLSAAMLESATSDDLLLHLVATHHGSGRPFAGAVEENDLDVKRPFNRSQFGRELKIDSSRQDIAAWNATLPERFWRIVRKLGWWGSAYHEAVFRLADHAQSRWEQEGEDNRDEKVLPPIHVAPFKHSKTSPLHEFPLIGLDGSNPLAFLAALGTLVACDQLSGVSQRPKWLTSPVRLSWGLPDLPYAPVLHFSSEPPTSDEFIQFFADRLPRSVEQHAAAWVVGMLEQGNKKDAVRDFMAIKRLAVPQRRDDRPRHDWITALSCESALDADSQLQTVRCDYLIGNVKSLMAVTQPDHLRRSLFATWDYTDGLANQSLHWEPTEDRRHAYQWHMPSGDPTRKSTGGMVGANRLALEAWPLFPSFPDGDRVNTRGFRGNRANNTFWTWPLWSFPATVSVVESLMSLDLLHEHEVDTLCLRQLGVVAVFRLQRILVGKTPNFTTAIALA